MLLLALLLASEPPALQLVPVARAETLAVTITGTGPPVVMLPGLFGSAFGFRQITPLLAAEGYQAIVVEPLGIGGSSRPFRSDYSLTAQAVRVAAALDSLGIGPVLMVAHSVGASIAFRLAAERPDLVTGILSLEGGPAEAAATPGFRRAMKWAPWLRLFGGRGLVRKKIHESLIKSSADTTWISDSVVAGYTAAIQEDFGAALGAYYRMAESREPWRLQPRLADVQCPVLLMIGTAPHQGGPRPEEVLLLRDSLAAFSVDSVAGIGHFPFEERPSAVIDAVRRLDAGLRLALEGASRS